MTTTSWADSISASMLVASKEVEEGYVPFVGADDNTWIYLDTAGSTVNGFFKVFDDGDRDMSMHIPPGFRAYDRLVELYILPNGRTRGRLICPAGFDLEEDWGINLEDRICPNPRVDDVALLGAPGTTPVLPGPGTYQLVVTGTNFVPWLGGVAGTKVLFVDSDRHQYDNFVVTDVVWTDVSEIVVTVVIPPGVQAGPRRIEVVNPVDFPSKRGARDNVLRIE